MPDHLTLPFRDIAEAAQAGVLVLESVGVEDGTGFLQVKSFRVEDPSKAGFLSSAHGLPRGTTVEALSHFSKGGKKRVLEVRSSDLTRFSHIGSKVGLTALKSESVFLHGSVPLTLPREEVVDATFVVDGRETRVFVANPDVLRTGLLPANMLPASFAVPANVIPRPLVTNGGFNPNRLYYRSEELVPQARSAVEIRSALEKLAQERIAEVRLSCPHSLPPHWDTLSPEEFRSVELWNSAFQQGWRPMADILESLFLDASMSSNLEEILDAHVPLPGTKMPTLYRRISFKELTDNPKFFHLLTAAAGENLPFILRCITSDSARIAVVSGMLSKNIEKS